MTQGRKPKQLADKKATTTVENRYIFETRDAGQNTIGEYIELLKTQIVKLQGENAQLQIELLNSKAAIDDQMK